MKVLSVKQPWAELEVQGIKTLEIRGRTTHYRGELAIHASRSYDNSPAAMAAVQRAGYLSPAGLPRGRIVGVVDLTSSDPWEPQHLGDACIPWRPAQWAWTFTNPRRADCPIPLRGQLGLWNLPDNAVQVRP